MDFLEHMNAQVIEDNGYKVECNPETSTVIFQGALRLPGSKEYAPIEGLLLDLIKQSPETITLDLQQLNFLNSSGISMLLKFAVNARSLKTTQVVVLGSNEISWQSKSLRTIERLLPSVQLTLL